MGYGSELLGVTFNKWSHSSNITVVALWADAGEYRIVR